MIDARPSPTVATGQQAARQEAIRISREELARAAARDADGLSRRCARLGLPPPSGGAVEFPLFDGRARLELPGLELSDPAGAELPQADRILVYHYLNYEGELPEGGDPVSFRDFPGGSFYWEPFRSRSCLPLAKRYGKDPVALRDSLGRYEWEELGFGDFSARVRGFGRLGLVLVLHADREGLGAEVNALFDPAVRRAFSAEDAVAFASRICLSLLRRA